VPQAYGLIVLPVLAGHDLNPVLLRARKYGNTLPSSCGDARPVLSEANGCAGGGGVGVGGSG